MQPLAIVDLLDERGEPPSHIVKALVLPAVDLFDLESLHEALGGGVVIGVAFAGHADQAAMRYQGSHVVMGGVLYPLIGVMDDTRPGAARPECPMKRLQA